MERVVLVLDPKRQWADLSSALHMCVCPLCLRGVYTFVREQHRSARPSLKVQVAESFEVPTDRRVVRAS